MAMLTSALASYQVRILDVGQAVIHDELSLGMLIEVSDSSSAAEALDELERACKEAGVALRSNRISALDYQDWVASQGKSRHILTLLAAGVSGRQISAVTSIFGYR